TLDTAHAGFPLFAPLLAVAGDGNTGYFLGTNNRYGIEQEFRVSYTGDSRLTWVGGAFLSRTSTAIQYLYLTNNAVQDAALRQMYGHFSGPGAGQQSESTARYGLANDQGYQAFLRADILDKEFAVFAEGNLWLVRDKLKLIGGLRYSELELN